MKRENSGIGFSSMNKDHWQKSLGDVSVADTKYAKSDVDNEPEMKSNVNALTSYVKNHRMKY